jgi:S1/P1 Nuclease
MRRFFHALVLATCTPTLAFAWGEIGHRAVAEIAARHLSDSAQVGVADLLGPGPNALAGVAVWADHIIGERPETAPWHMVEIPPDGARYDRTRDCRNGDCIVERIKEFARIIGQAEAAKPVRAEALKFLVHLVGDLHMPFHAYAPLNRPKGTWVQVGEIREKLHLWWDDRVLREDVDAGGRVERLTVRITADQRLQWNASVPEDWANESFQISHEFVTRHRIIDALRDGNNSEQTPIVLAASVFAEARPILARRLQMAGVRLARLLNEAFEKRTADKVQP